MAVATVDLRAVISLMERGDFMGADVVLKPLLQSHPEHPQALHLKGLILRRVGRNEQAIELFNQSLAVNEDQPNVYNNLAIALIEAGRLAEAEDSYRRALKLHPTFHDAAFNLALLLMDGKKWQEAATLLKAVVRAVPSYSKGFEALAIALRECGDRDGSVSAAERATKLSPQSPVAHHNLGAALAAREDHAGAQRAFEHALRLRPESDVSWVRLGYAIHSQGRVADAAKVFERAVNVNPGNLEAHRMLNELMWQSGDTAKLLDSYGWAMTSRPEDIELRQAYANQLLQFNRVEEAKQVLLQALTVAGAHPGVNDTVARALAMGGDVEQALHYHRRAVDMAPSEPRFYKSFVESMLKARRHAQARDWAKTGLQHAPDDQILLALYTTGLRLTGDAEHDRIADYSQLPRVYDLDPPAGHRDTGAFNASFAEQLRKLHVAKFHPTDQTLRGGTQTFGTLFARQIPVIAQFKTMVSKAIRAYIEDMPQDADHPLFRRKARAFDFSGSWSVRLGKQGFHTNHVHPEGWLSSVYYVTVPDAKASASDHAGWLKMGETNLELGIDEAVLRYEQAKPGRLILFPSYFWHGTVPFDTDEERLTVAFDVVPTS